MGITAKMRHGANLKDFSTLCDWNGGNKSGQIVNHRDGLFLFMPATNDNGFR